MKTICKGIIAWGPEAGRKCTRETVTHPYTREGKKLDENYCQMHQPGKVSKNRVCCPNCGHVFVANRYSCKLIPQTQKKQNVNVNLIAIEDDETIENVSFGTKAKTKKTRTKKAKARTKAKKLKNKY